MNKMFNYMLIICALICFANGGLLRQKKQSNEKWGYVNVRENAYMFWWLYYADSTVRSDLPLVIWLQGGPGGSSTGFGNFNEIGPLDVNSKPRNTTWVKYANVLFIDNPVGTGYSYVSQDNAYATNNTQIATDLVTLMKSFFNQLPEFQNNKLYVFSESYGGKMTTTFAVHLHNAIKNNEITCNFKGIALGDSWISPIDSVASWSDYLETMSLIDGKGKATVDSYVKQIRNALQNKQYASATDLWGDTENVVGGLTDGVNWYNILQWSSSQDESKKFHNILSKNPNVNKGRAFNALKAYFGDSLSDLMNGPIRQKLGIIPSNVTWGGQSGQVFQALTSDFMLPVTDQIDYLLNKTDLQVVVYTGQLDLIVDTLGTLNWIHNLKWPSINDFFNSERDYLLDGTNQLIGFKKQYKNFEIFWILNAGHMVPADAGNSALVMLRQIIG